MAEVGLLQKRGRWLFGIVAGTIVALLFGLTIHMALTSPVQGRSAWHLMSSLAGTALAQGPSSPAAHASRKKASVGTSQRDQFVPAELQQLLVCITMQFNVAKTSHWEIMLLEAIKYDSMVLDVLIVTDKADAMRRVLDRMLLPLNISYYEAQKPPDDNNKYWLAWEHRKAIEVKVAGFNYTTVVYMEDDTRLTWPALVSWAIDTRLLGAYNLSRCFFRTEVSPAGGGLLMLDYKTGIDVRPSSHLKRLDLQATGDIHYQEVAAELDGLACGQLLNGTTLPCIAHAHFTASPHPFQGMWLATRAQLARFMSLPMWTKTGALAFDTKPYLVGSPGDQNWGYPERSASIAILGGLTQVVPGQGTYGSCMLPYRPRTGDVPAELACVASVNHLRNAYGNWGSIPIEQSMIS